ncbi:hypothetical protein [Archangium sp.]|uniref:hypothetical protein n=1 Tax=Archangium sp. TaxID=1872627 RepID=UPI00286B840A|nr:hypothetical protein [Archangium sp.]
MAAKVTTWLRFNAPIEPDDAGRQAGTGWHLTTPACSGPCLQTAHSWVLRLKMSGA